MTLFEHEKKLLEDPDYREEWFKKEIESSKEYFDWNLWYEDNDPRDEE